MRTYANGKEPAPGDLVVDINTGELLIVERVDQCPTSNVVAHPALSLGITKDSAELMLLRDSRTILNLEKQGRLKRVDG